MLIVDYLDRNNISAARLRGLQEDLKLNDQQYSTCLSILYVGYILMQVPSNMIINKIQRPSIYIGVAVNHIPPPHLNNTDWYRCCYGA